MRAVKSIQQFLNSSLESVHKYRIRALFWAVCSLLVGGRLSLTGLGRSARGRTSPKHNIKRVNRLLGNRLLHEQTDTIYKAIANILVGGKKRPVVIIDWMGLNRKQATLVAGIPVDGRAMPIYCRVYKIQQNNNPVIHKKFLKKLHEILPKNCRPIIVTDAGFHNAWFRDVVYWGWDFVGRILSNSRARTLTDPQWFPVFDLFRRATVKAKDLGRFVVSESTPACLRLVIIRNKYKGTKSRLVGSRCAVEARNRSNKPWLLATSLADVSAKKIVSIYAMRMQIEESFRDTKNLRYGWSFRHARSRSVKRLEVLLLISALGMLAVTLVGLYAEKSGIHRKYQANTVKDHRVLSLFYLGMNLILREEHFLICHMDLRATLQQLKGNMSCLEMDTASVFLGIN